MFKTSLYGKGVLRWAVVSLAALLAACLPGGPAASIVVRVQEVFLAPAGGDQSLLPAGVKKPLNNGDRVRTSDLGEALANLGCGTVLIFGGSNLQVKEVSANSANLTAAGSTLFNTTCQDIQVASDPPEALVRTTGTIFLLSFNAERHVTLLWTQAGTAHLSNVSRSGPGASAAVPNGMWSLIRAGGDPSPARPVAEMGPVVTELHLERVYNQVLSTLEKESIGPAPTELSGVATIVNPTVNSAPPLTRTPTPRANNTVTLTPRPSAWRLTREIRVSDVSVARAEFSPDGTRVLAAGADSQARIIDLTTGERVRTFQHKGAVTDAHFSSDGKLVVTASEDRTAASWQSDTGKQIFSFQGHSGQVNTVALSPDNRALVTSSDDGTARVWPPSQVSNSVALPTPPIVLKGHDGAVKSAVFSPVGQFVLTASLDGTARLWPLSDVRLPVIYKSAAPLLNAAFSPDGNLFATAGADAHVRVWRIGAVNPELDFQGGVGGVRDAQFSPSGKTIAVGDERGTIRIFDAGNGNLVETLEGPGTVIRSVRYGRNQSIVAASDDGFIRVWDLPQ